MRLPPVRHHARRGARRAPQAPTGEAGFALIEVLVSALIVVIVGGAVLTLLQTTARSAGDQRRHATAFALAQEDQSRLRTTRLATLNRLQEERTVSVDGQAYTIESTGIFVNSSTGTSSCTEGYESADYAQITSTVTWPGIGSRKPVSIESVVAPSSGSLDPTHGTLTISATNAAGEPLSGVAISGTGPGTFSGSTDTSGCANFTDLPEGNYAMTSSAGGMVDEYGETVGERTVGVRASTTVTVALRFDVPGEVAIDSTYLDAGGAVRAAGIDSLFFYHPEFTEGGKVLGEPGGPRTARREVGPLFPFTSPYTFYAGSCESNNPNPDNEAEPPGAAALANVTIVPGEPAEATIQVPTLYVTVTDGPTPIQGANLMITDDECQQGGSNVERQYTTNADGQQSLDGSGATEPALPWGTYDVCANAYYAGRWRRQRQSNVEVKNLAAGGAQVSLDLTGSGADSRTNYGPGVAC